VLGAGLGMQRLLGLREAWQRVAFWLAYLSLYSVSWVVLHGSSRCCCCSDGCSSSCCRQRGGRSGRRGAGAAAGEAANGGPSGHRTPVEKTVARAGVFAAIAYVLVAVSLLVAGPKIIIDYRGS